MIQAQLAADALRRRFPEHEFELTPMTTHADRHPSMRLSDAPREGVFVQELEQALLDGGAELAVHSAKDLPTLATPSLTIAAFLPRADARDALIAREPAQLGTLPPGSRIGTGSPRRAAQLAALRPDLRAVDIRGNVDTRLRRLREGAVAVVCPVIEIEPIGVDPDQLRLDQYDWLVLTSANGVDRLVALGSLAEGRVPAHIKVAAIGPQTAARLLEHGVRATIVPARYVAEELADSLIRVTESGARVLLARAAGARDALPQRLTEHGAQVTVVETYRAVAPAGTRQQLAERISGVDMVTFTSSSAVRNFVEALDGVLSSSVLVACIGPITAQSASDLGLRVDIIAQEYTTRGLVDAIVRSGSSTAA